jgi:pentapeptide MXKDX repeat protein
MKKTLCKLMVMCFLAVPLAVVAQSGDNMKQDQSQQDQMKHDDTMKNDNPKQS